MGPGGPPGLKPGPGPPTKPPGPPGGPAKRIGPCIPLGPPGKPGPPNLCSITGLPIIIPPGCWPGPPGPPSTGPPAPASRLGGWPPGPPTMVITGAPMRIPGLGKLLAPFMLTAIGPFCPRAIRGGVPKICILGPA